MPVQCARTHSKLKYICSDKQNNNGSNGHFQKQPLQNQKEEHIACNFGSVCLLPALGTTQLYAFVSLALSSRTTLKTVLNGYLFV